MIITHIPAVGRRFLTFCLAFGLAMGGLGTVQAQTSAGIDAGSAVLLPFASQEGLARLAHSGSKEDFAPLANQFEPQSNAAFCGPTTATIVLNAVHGRDGTEPRDRSRLQPGDLLFLPSTADLSLPRFTQETVITKGRKTRSQVFGEPVTIDGKPVMDVGYQVRQLDEMLRANGLSTQLVIVDESITEASVRSDFRRNLQTTGDYVIVNYTRKAVGQKGGGHISPLGAYDEATDSVLVLDVNPTSAGWVWMPVPLLFHAMRTFDTVENRGYILVNGRSRQ